jgi:hypothetical protein
MSPYRSTALARAVFLPFMLLGAVGLVGPAGADAQQFVVDDAVMAEYRSCHLEVWHGQSTSWILPGCQPVRNLELSAGVGFVDIGDGRDTEYVLQGKYLFRGLAPNDFGVGFVGGIGYAAPAPLSRGVAGVFAYIPSSLSLSDDRVVLHGNLGWHLQRDDHEHNGVVHEDPHHALTWGARADLLLPLRIERFTLVGELFGEDRLLPEFQVGVRGELFAERLFLDLSWGGNADRELPGAGWTVGLAWLPPPFF